MASNGLKVLCAEDEVLLRSMVTDALRDAGFQVFEASDAEESILILRTISVNVVVTDLRMATLTDGLEVGRYVRAYCPGVSLVLASAQAPPITADLMFDDFFVKPFAPEDLAAWIKRRHAAMGRSNRGLLPDHALGVIGASQRNSLHWDEAVEAQKYPNANDVKSPAAVNDSPSVVYQNLQS